MKKFLCKLFGHCWNEYHLYEVVCSRCRTCREWTTGDAENFDKIYGGMTGRD